MIVFIFVAMQLVKKKDNIFDSMRLQNLFMLNGSNWRRLRKVLNKPERSCLGG